MRTPQHRLNAFQQLRLGRQCHLHVAGQFEKFSVKRFMEYDDPNHQPR